jgi:hypothetical protein
MMLENMESVSPLAEASLLVDGVVEKAERKGDFLHT